MQVLEANTICDLDGETLHDLFYWTDVLANHLHNASIKDKSFLEKKFIFCKEYVEMHADFLSKEMNNLGNIRRAFAEHYIILGDLETCDRWYEEWLAKEPDWGLGWIGWSDSYWLFACGHNPNVEKAQQILAKGLAVPGVLDQQHLKDRLSSPKEFVANRG